MDLNQLLKNATSTSDESENEPANKSGKRPDRFTRIEEGFTQQFTALGIMVMPFHMEDGTLILNRANPLAARITDVARQNPAVYKALKKYLENSVYMMLAEELGVISLGLLANHGINPVGWIIDKMKGKQADGDSELQSVA